MSLATSLPEYSKEVQATLVQFFARQEKQAAVIDASLEASLNMLRDFSLRGGKAIRSYLVKLAYDLAGGQPHRGLIKVAAAIDLHHKHILILDDIADRDQSRYGGPTIEWAYKKVFAKVSEGEHRARTFAMMDGVWLGALARQLLYESGFEPGKLLICQEILNTLMFRDTLAGWQIHGLECDKKISQVTPQEFTKGLELVTARYTFEGPFKLGLALAGNKDPQLESVLTKYSQFVGTAFQIHDDILGLFGDTKKTGKPVGNDVREGKKTLLIQIAYKRAKKTDRAFLEKVCGKAKLTKKDISRVQKIVTQTGSLDYSLTLEKQMVEKGIAALNKLPASVPKQILIELAQFVVTRDK